ncbi:uncharacterized protein LOC105423111 [Pogonomyrmex barbatus]|uniref:Uncharacterized protein LOC105423111 n=1 Tax=Pogonomyrmex barbatus TaxID=144034 RepID=A0A6I9VQJ6_9HYME|nr:uncharacterized protein LOC105423111 [Pogonomyrmex barbatus]
MVPDVRPALDRLETQETADGELASRERRGILPESDSLLRITRTEEFPKLFEDRFAACAIDSFRIIKIRGGLKVTSEATSPVRLSVSPSLLCVSPNDTKRSAREDSTIRQFDRFPRSTARQQVRVLEKAAT